MRQSNQGEKTLEDIIKFIKTNHADGSGIIYCLTRKETENVAEYLSCHGVKAQCFHAYMDPIDKVFVHKMWCNGKISVCI